MNGRPAVDAKLVWTWSDYYRLAQELAQRMKALAPAETHSLCVRAPDLRQGLLALGAADQLGWGIIFDEKSRFPAEKNGIFVLPETALPPSAPALVIELKPGSTNEALPLRPDLLKVTFSTSGSSGQTKFIKKAGPGLCAEVEALRRLFALKSEQSVLSLVRPFHIYGFLHALLLPLSVRAGLTFWPSSDTVPVLSSLPIRPDLLIAVPSQWSLIQYVLEHGGLGTLVSSGAPFGVQREESLRLYQGSYQYAYEILGSTETGGIAHRRLDQEDRLFQLFEEVSVIEMSEEGTLLHSAFVAPEAEAFTSDRLELLEGGRVRHRGRADRVFKYGGKRFSLSEIEEALSVLSGGVSVVCHYAEDFSRAQGGTLRAWIESTVNCDVPALRIRYLSQFDLPFPQRIVQINHFPRDAQGKLQMQQLMQDA